jgi:hypothetical protein
MIVDSPATVVTAAQVPEDCAGQILVGGSLVKADAIERAVRLRARAIVVGGIEDATLRSFLGYDIGVAITGSEKKGLTIVATEGFGEMRMAQRTFELLKSLEGRTASVNGATQIRAGVIRPEVIVPADSKSGGLGQSTAEGGLALGMAVRIIRQPNFGRIGRVTSLPVELQSIETEAKARVLEVELDDGKRVLMPRANVEIIES